MNIVSNKYYHQWRTRYSEDIDFLKSLTLFDTVVYCLYPNEDNSGIQEGKIQSITLKGVDVSTPYGNRFVKFYNVKEVHKI